MNISIALQFVVVLFAIWAGAKVGGIGLGLWGGIGLLALVVLFGVAPTAPPVDVMLIILAVITAASVMDAAGGIDFLVRIAERIIRANPRYVTIVAPLTTWAFTFLAGTGHIVYPLLPVIFETAHQNGIRPERPMAVATIASQQAVTASPVAAATAAMIGLFSQAGLNDWGLPQLLLICVPATLAGVLAAAVVSLFVGRELDADPVYRARLEAGLIAPARPAQERPPLPASAARSALLFLGGVATIVLLGFFPEARKLPGAGQVLPMPVVIEIVMLAVAAIMLLATRTAPEAVPRTATMRAGIVAVVGIFGLAWLGDSFISAHKEVIVPVIGDLAATAPWLFAFGLFFASVLLYSQAATTRALMPLGIALGIPPQFLIAMFPSVNGYFFIPTYGSLIAAINFDLTGTTRIGRYILNHSFMLPGLVATIVAVGSGMVLARLIY
ncbi:MAG TPA: anaerobic C4-dicarboxylate transporter [Azonexus sp.]